MLQGLRAAVRRRSSLPWAQHVGSLALGARNTRRHASGAATCGPVVGSVTSTTARILLEFDVGRTVTCTATPRDGGRVVQACVEGDILGYFSQCDMVGPS